MTDGQRVHGERNHGDRVTNPSAIRNQEQWSASSWYTSTVIALLQRGLLLVVAALALVGCGSISASSSEQPETRDGERTPPPVPVPPAISDVVPPPAASALAAIDSLLVKGRAPKTGCSREQFGTAWYDADHNGCDTRNDVLARDLISVQRRAGSDCVVIAGVLRDPYIGRDISFSKADASAVQIDHVVALSDSWQKGSQYWDQSKRVALANDPLNLLAVDGPTNGAKGDGDAATWLPPNKSYRCAYVARQVAVKLKYGIWVTAAEADAMRRVLSACPEEELPSDSGAPVTVTSAAVEEPHGKSGKANHYRTCADARAAGVTPIRTGTPLYDANRHLDRDGDGVACE